MEFTPKNINKFMLFKIPSAYLSGIRVVEMDEDKAVATVKYQWINQNPFKSLYWATQGMASELVTGILLMDQIAKTQRKISMLVTKQTGEFTKKATGKITFTCDEAFKIKAILNKAIESKEGQTILLTSSGIDEKGETVSNFTYTWSIKLKEN